MRVTILIDGSVAAPPGQGDGLDETAIRVLLPEDRAIREELARDVAGGRDIAARVAAQVDDERPLARSTAAATAASNCAAAWSEKPASRI